MKRAVVLVILAFVVLKAAPAMAWPCPHGEFRRVSLHRCVSVASALAREYEGRRHVVLRLEAPKPVRRELPVVRIAWPKPAPKPEPPIVLPTLPDTWSE